MSNTGVSFSDISPVTISRVMVENEFLGDYVYQCDLCDIGSGRAAYSVLLSYAMHHVSQSHEETIVITDGNDVYFE
jgi:hypothetical protein